MKAMRTALFLSVCAFMLSGGSSAQGTKDRHTYYVDFANGSDGAAGTSQTTAWKHSPGDSQATGVPAKIALASGDTVLFRAGVTYRGSIDVKNSGSADAPITLSGQGWGEGHAIISGRDVVEASPKPCSSSPVCARLSNPGDFVVIDLTIPVTTYSQIALDGHILQLSQAPKPAEAFWFDDTANYIEAKTDQLAPLSDGKTWQLRNDYIAKNLGDDAVNDLLVLVLSYPNVITSGPAALYDPKQSSVLFQPEQFQRSDKATVVFALANHPRLITQPYEYATIEHGTKIIVRAPLTPAKLEVSRRAWCFVAIDQKNIVIKGFEIEGFADGPKGGGGAALATRDAENIRFEGNDVHDLENWAGGGAAGGEPVTGLTIIHNRFHNLPHGSGVRIGKGTNIRVSDNLFDNIGRTGIMVMNSQHSLVDHNILRHLYGSHGNGISIYLDNRDAIVSNNLVSDTTRAVTFEGSGNAAVVNNIVFKENLFKANGSGGVALQSWGDTNGVVIERNILLVDDSVHAMRLSGRDKNVSVKQNVIDGYQSSPMTLPDDTKIEGNIFVSESRGSTSGNDVESDYRKIADAFFKTSENVDPKLCKFLLNGSSSPIGIGPSDACLAH